MPCITHRPDPLLLRGTLTVFRRRCGKPNCRCVSGDPHQSPALVLHDAGRTKTVTLSAAEIEEVSAALARYRDAKAALEASADAGLAALLERRAARRRKAAP